MYTKINFGNGMIFAGHSSMVMFCATQTLQIPGLIRVFETVDSRSKEYEMSSEASNTGQ